eukprot:3204-Heterococcus_DN1.PRE.2
MAQNVSIMHISALPGVARGDTTGTAVTVLNSVALALCSVWTDNRHRIRVSPTAVVTVQLLYGIACARPAEHVVTLLQCAASHLYESILHM